MFVLPITVNGLESLSSLYTFLHMFVTRTNLFVKAKCYRYNGAAIVEPQLIPCNKQLTTVMKKAYSSHVLAIKFIG